MSSFHDGASLMQDPTLPEATAAVFTEEQRQELKSRLRSAQIDQSKYLRTHPEIQEAMQLALSKVLEAQPEAPLEYLVDYFTSDEFVVLNAEEAD